MLLDFKVSKNEEQEKRPWAQSNIKIKCFSKNKYFDFKKEADLMEFSTLAGRNSNLAGVKDLAGQKFAGTIAL